MCGPYADDLNASLSQDRHDLRRLGHIDGQLPQLVAQRAIRLALQQPLHHGQVTPLGRNVQRGVTRGVVVLVLPMCPRAQLSSVGTCATLDTPVRRGEAHHIGMARQQ